MARRALGAGHAPRRVQVLRPDSGHDSSELFATLSRVVAVEAEPKDWTTTATFETGERRRYDVGPLLGRGVFRAISEPEAFVAVGMGKMGGVTWEVEGERGPAE